MKNNYLDIRYASIHGFYWMLVCAMIGYASVFMLDKGFDNTTIGLVLSLSNIFAVIGQPVIASFLDKKSKSSLRIVISFIAGLIVVLSLLLSFLTQASLFLIVLMIICFTLALTLQPFINSLVFVFEKHNIQINFGLARGIGSVAYAVMSLLLGNLVATWSPQLLPFFYVGLSLCVLVMVYTFYLPESKEDVVVKDSEDIGEQLSMVAFLSKYKLYLFVLLATVLLFFDHALINNFFIQVIYNIGGNSGDMGNAIFLAAVLELPTMVLFTRLRHKIGCRRMLLIAGVFFSVKHVLTYFAVNMFMLYIAQIMQMFAYAIFIPASVYYVRQLVDYCDMNKGQALMTGAMTLSGVFASFLGGRLLDELGVSDVLLIGAIVSILGTICLFFSVEDVDKKTSVE